MGWDSGWPSGAMGEAEMEEEGSQKRMLEF